jgi:hypothetical protein
MARERAPTPRSDFTARFIAATEALPSRWEWSWEAAGSAA